MTDRSVELRTVSLKTRWWSQKLRREQVWFLFRANVSFLEASAVCNVFVCVRVHVDACQCTCVYKKKCGDIYVRVFTLY